MKKLFFILAAALAVTLSSCEVLEDVLIAIEYYRSDYGYDNSGCRWNSFYYHSYNDCCFDGSLYFYDDYYYASTTSGYYVCLQKGYSGYRTEIVTVLPGRARRVDFDFCLSDGRRQLEFSSWGERLIFRLLDTHY